MSASPDADLPVAAYPARALERSRWSDVSTDGRSGVPTMLPAVQAAAVAAGGFAAGAAVVRLANRRRRERTPAPTPKRRGRSVARPRRRPLLLRRRRAQTDREGVATVLEIVGSRSLLVDVHLLGSSRER